MSRPGAAPTQPEYPSTPYAWYVVVILTIGYVISFLDRQILALLLEPIRRDLNLSDTQMGLIMGSAFALFYTILGLPIGRLADRYSRRGIIATGVTIWCGMTAACGLASNFTQLFLARVGAGVGEATLNPSALSMISDYFPRERRGRAISFYNMGVSVGAGIALLVGGWVIGAVASAPPVSLPLVGELQLWQSVFMIVGLPGLVIAALMATVREPTRRDKIRITNADGTVTEDISIRETIRYLVERRHTFASHFLAMSVVTIIGYAFLFWIPTMFIRTWNWDIGRISIWYGTVVITTGPLGVICAGWLADRWFRKGKKDAHMRVCRIGAIVMATGAVLAPLMPSGELALVMLIPMSLGGGAVTATGVAGLMMITPNQVRAQTTALYYFVINVLGLSIGGAAVGIITDSVFGDDADLRYTLALVSFVAGSIALLFFRMNLRHYAKAITEAEEWSE
jgi:MFS family permease